MGRERVVHGWEPSSMRALPKTRKKNPRTKTHKLVILRALAPEVGSPLIDTLAEVNGRGGAGPRKSGLGDGVPSAGRPTLVAANEAVRADRGFRTVEQREVRPGRRQGIGRSDPISEHQWPRGFRRRGQKFCWIDKLAQRPSPHRALKNS